MDKVDRRKIPKADRDPPTTGQSGPPVDLDLEKMNEVERLIVETLAPVESMDISDLAKALVVVHPEEWASRAKLLIRNALRRLVSSRWVHRVSKGVYAITETGKFCLWQSKAKKQLAEGE